MEKSTINEQSWDLYNFSQEFENLLEALEGEVTDDVEDAEKFLKQLKEEHLEDLARFRRGKELRIEMCKAEKTRISALQKKCEQDIEYANLGISRVLVSLGEKKKLVGTFLVKLRQGVFKVFEPETLDFTKIPKKYVRVKTTESLDKKALLSVWKESGQKKNVLPKGFEVKRGEPTVTISEV